MSDISSATTDAELAAAYDDTASYAEDNSLPKARKHRTVILVLIRRRPQIHAINNRSSTFANLDSQLDRVTSFIDNYVGSDGSTGGDAGPRVTRVDFRNFR